MCKVSIIVPVHNTARYLEETVLSIRQQTLKDIEIILVENASSDESLEICHRLATEDARIRVCHLDKGDLSTARNEGVRLAKSDFVGFIDSDDVIDTDMYETLYTTASTKGLDLVTCNYVRYVTPKKIKFQYCEDGKTQIVSPKEMVRLNLMEIIPQSACTLLVKKSIVEEIPFPADKYFEDRSTTFQFIAASASCAYINRSFYHYYQFRGNIRSSRSFKRNHDFAEADLIRLKFIQDSGIFTSLEKPEIAAKASESLLRKINRMRHSADTPEERSEMRQVMQGVRYIPEGTRLSLKARIIRFFIKRRSND